MRGVRVAARKVSGGKGRCFACCSWADIECKTGLSLAYNELMVHGFIAGWLIAL